MRERLLILADGLKPHGVFVAALLLLADRYGFAVALHNELDTLPLARQAVDAEWLPQDWYLNLAPGYRAAFDFTVGWLFRVFSNETGAVLGRFLSFVLFAAAFQGLTRALGLDAGGSVLTIWAFLPHQSLVAGEWMVGGLETKPFAYALVWLALAAMLRRRYASAFLMLGASVTFHVLVGLYATLCVGVMLLSNGDWLALDRQRVLRSVLCFLPTGALGGWAVFQQLLGPHGEAARQAARIHVHFRNPHHLLPSSWEFSRAEWAGWLMLGIIVLLAAVALAHGNPRHRLVATFALASAGLFALGLLWAELDADWLLQYFWFRFPDTVLPFVSCLLLVDVLIAGLTRWRHGRWGRLAVFVLSVGVTAWAGVSALKKGHQWLTYEGHVFAQVLEPARLDAQLWVRAHTPRRAVFFVDPFLDEFYVVAERARLASFKHAPQSAEAIVKWYHRLMGLDADPFSPGKALAPQMQVRQRFQGLSASDILALAQAYELTHALVAADADPLQAPELRPAEVYRNSVYVVYDLRRLTPGANP